MVTPYDWQEGIGHRASYVEGRLSGGSPVLALSLPDGILSVTVRRQTAKHYEVYDRLMFAAIGQQSDVEAMRVAAIDFAHQEGFIRSEADVTVQRVVSALSNPLKRAFGDFNTSPFVIRAMFAEVGETIAQDTFYVLEYDGDFHVREGWCALTGDGDVPVAVRDLMAQLAAKPPKKVVDVVSKLQEAWAMLMDPASGKSFQDLAQNLQPEAVLLRRGAGVQRRFQAVEAN